MSSVDAYSTPAAEKRRRGSGFWTVAYAFLIVMAIAALLGIRSVAARVGRRGVMLGAVATMMASAGLLAAWKALPGLLIGRLLTGVAVGLGAGTAITYLIELRLRADPNASMARARDRRAHSTGDNSQPADRCAALGQASSRSSSRDP